MSKRLEQYFYLVLGSTLLTLGIWLFVTPNQINFGGMIGLAQLIDYFIHKFCLLYVWIFKLWISYSKYNTFTNILYFGLFLINYAYII